MNIIDIVIQSKIVTKAVSIRVYDFNVYKVI